MKKFIILVAALLFAFPVRADALSGANFLKINPSPLSVSMGDLSSPIFLPNSVFLNPAGTARTQGYTLWASHADWVVDMGMEMLSFAVPLKKAGCAGIGLRIFDYGVLDIREADSDRVSDIITPRDVQVLLNYSRRIGPVYAGVNAGYTMLELYSQKVNNLTFDFGAIYKIDSPDLAVGASVRNLGLNYKYQTGKSAGSPLTASCGAVMGFYNGDIRGGAELGYDIDGRIKAGIGLELKLKDKVFPRVGYKLGPGNALENITAGAGFSLDFPWPIKIEYAYETLSGIGAVHRVGLETVFYAKKAKTGDRQKTRKPKAADDGEDENENEDGNEE